MFPAAHGPAWPVSSLLQVPMLFTQLTEQQPGAMQAHSLRPALQLGWQGKNSQCRLGSSATLGTGVLAGQQPGTGKEIHLSRRVPCTLTVLHNQAGVKRGVGEGDFFLEDISACGIGTGHCPLCSYHGTCLCLLSGGY